MSAEIKGGGNAALVHFGGLNGSVDGILHGIGSGVHIATDTANSVGAGRQRHHGDQGENGYETD